MRKAAVYLRASVSTRDQTTDNQEHELREVANRMGCEIVKVYLDEGVGGAKGQKRPQLEKLLLDAYNRKFDMVMAWSVDRLGRSLQDLVSCPKSVTSRSTFTFTSRGLTPPRQPATRSLR
jgi:DNA invertase Pin-like site-specific DNA recombinase